MTTPQTAGNCALVSISGLNKVYGGVRALTDINLSVSRGSVHAIVGENGAGKSTLMKILAGAEVPNSGQIRIDGEAVELKSPVIAGGLGVGIVYQELTIFPERSILANLFVARQPTRRGVVDRFKMARIAQPVLSKMGLELPLSTPVSSLGVGEQQLVELTRLLIQRPKLLILDEPNSALNEQETQRLFDVLRGVVSSGTTVIYVSHRLEEVFQIADRVTVMRNGKVAWTKDCSMTSIPEVVNAMVGMEMNQLFPVRHTANGKTYTSGSLHVSGLTIVSEVHDVSFTANPGEIVGIAGLEGSGTATVLGAIFGTRRATSGEIRYPDNAGVVKSATGAARRGISLVPADRKVQGLMLDRSVEWNMSQVVFGALKRTLWFSHNSMRQSANRQIDRLKIKTSDSRDDVSGLSGGNQQKVVIGKWLEIQPNVFLLDDPTRGVDVGAKAEIYRLIRELSTNGAIVLFRSSELPELVGLADRILIMYRGRMIGEVSGESATDALLLTAINSGHIVPV